MKPTKMLRFIKPKPKLFMISRKSFELNKKVWLFNSKLKLFPGKLRSGWDGPFVVQQVFPFGVIKILDPQNGRILLSTVNG